MHNDTLKEIYRVAFQTNLRMRWIEKALENRDYDFIHERCLLLHNHGWLNQNPEWKQYAK